MHRKEIQGNVLFLILVGIALLAALIFTVTRSEQRKGGMKSESTAFAGQALLRYGDDLHAAVQMLVNIGQDISTFSFETTETGVAYHNAAASAATSVFNSVGGGVKYVAPDAGWLDSQFSGRDFFGKWYFPNNLCVPFVGRGADGSGVTTVCSADGVSNNELIAVLPYIQSAICTYINQSVGIALCAGVPCANAASLLPVATQDEYAGTLTNGIALLSGTVLNGHETGCVQGTGTSAGMYFYYRVLLAR